MAAPARNAEQSEPPKERVSSKASSEPRAAPHCKHTIPRQRKRTRLRNRLVKAVWLNRHPPHMQCSRRTRTDERTRTVGRSLCRGSRDTGTDGRTRTWTSASVHKGRRRCRRGRLCRVRARAGWRCEEIVKQYNFSDTALATEVAPESRLRYRQVCNNDGLLQYFQYFDDFRLFFLFTLLQTKRFPHLAECSCRHSVCTIDHHRVQISFVKRKPSPRGVTLDNGILHSINMYQVLQCSLGNDANAKCCREDSCFPSAAS